MAPYTRTTLFYFHSLLFFCAFRLIFSNSNAVCPKKAVCFSGFSNVTYLWQNDDNAICHGQADGECYGGQKDPRGFIRGPLLKPLEINLGDRLFFEAFNGATIKPFNVTRSSFYDCKFNDEAIISSQSKRLEVPNRYINKAGIKFFIAESSSLLLGCPLGVRLEVFVQDTSPCINPSGGNDICSKKGLCSKTGKFFNYNMTCVCEAAYDGLYCEEFDSCQSNPCKNGATCVDKKSGFNNEYECKCVFGFTGKNCETNIDDCNPNPCKNNSICVDGIGSYTCLCGPGFNGKNCSIPIPNPCIPNPCENGGTCSLDSNRHNYTCKCADAFEGRNCSNNATIMSSALMSSSLVTSFGKSSL